jgi:double-stranded uracil-DNA glycosylase
VAFVGVSLYRMFFGPTASPGPGAKPEILAGARVFVVPNPSGLNASFPGFADKLVWFARLRAFVDKVDRLSRASPKPRSGAPRLRKRLTGAR